jgi:glycosyltransferase involved in cell wall biosynthesis
MGLTVVTHTLKSWNRDLSRCVDSINAALPENGKHIIIETNDNDNFHKARYDAMSLDDIVIFVDDDDYISPDSLKLCQQALEKTDVGIAFTREVKISTDGRSFTSSPPKSSKDILAGPEVIHHMVAYNTKHVSERSLRLLSTADSSAEWIMKTDALFRAGGIFIPIDGYYWIHHPQQDHRRAERQKIFRERRNYIVDEMRSWLNTETDILIW